MTRPGRLPEPPPDAAGGFFTRHRKAICFLVTVVCLAGGYAGWTMPASVFPETDFPRVVLLIDNGVMPADEMMATITRPVEEAMKDIPGTRGIRSATGRGSAEVNVFFDWATDMVEAELYVLGRVAQIRNTLPRSATLAVHRLTFAAFPMLGVSLTSRTRSITDLWETARYDLYPRLLRIGGVARIKLVGGRRPEYHVVVDPVRLEAYRLRIDDIGRALAAANLFTSAGMHEENRQLYLSVVDNRIRDPAEIGDVVVRWAEGAPVRVRDVAAVRHGAAPAFNVVTADGQEAVLFNVYAQPDSNTVAIADALHRALAAARTDLPPDMRLALFYDQSVFVREGVRSVWESIVIGLALSVLVLWGFLRAAAVTLVAAVVIPLTVLVTLLGMRLCGMGFDLMTLGGIAAAIGLIIDDAIVVVEAIHAKVGAGHAPWRAVGLAVREVGPPLVGSTLTPVVVFLPLAFLDGVAGVFFRALALTMVFALLASLVLAVTWTPALATFLVRPVRRTRDEYTPAGPVLGRLVAVFEWTLGRALRRSGVAALLLVLVAAGGTLLYRQLETDFLPEQDEGAFVLDYFSRPGTSLTETDRMLRHVEKILAATPEVESFSRRTGARLALAIAEPNTGDFLVKLRGRRARSTAEVVDELRREIGAAEPALHTEFPGVLADLIGDLTWSPSPIEIKVFSNDTGVLRASAKRIAAAIAGVPGVVDVNDGLVVAGPSLRFRVRGAEAARAGLTPASVGASLRTALLGDVTSYVLRGDRTYGVRVLDAPRAGASEQAIGALPLRSSGAMPVLAGVAGIDHASGLLEMHREDLRQLVAVSARLSGVDLGRGMAAIRHRLTQDGVLPRAARVEFGGLYEQQQRSFRNLALVLVTAIFLVFAVLVVEFRSFLAPLAIVAGAVLALAGAVVALFVTGTSLNIVSFLGAIIGVGIVAKNGILMLDLVEDLRAGGLSTFDALLRSGRRRLRPVLMTSLATFLSLLPLAWGVGAGADMLRPLAIAVIGTLFLSLLLSLVATPVLYAWMLRLLRRDALPSPGASS